MTRSAPVLALLVALTLAPALPLSAADPQRTPDYSTPGSGMDGPEGGSGITAIDPTASAFQVAKAMEGTPNIIKSANFVSSPTVGNFKGVSTTALTTFPSIGASFGMLSSGDVTFAPLANTAGSTSANNGAAPIRGNSAYDAVVLEIDIALPSGHVANCLSLEYRFLSEEYPEWVGTSFNDAFVAEIATSSWTANNAVIASPDNFAFSGPNELISINGIGATTQMNAAAASGTTYDGATPHYYAETPLTGGFLGTDTLLHYFLYLSVFDQSDPIYDSTVFVDNIQTVVDTQCARAPSTVLYP